MRDDDGGGGGDVYDHVHDGIHDDASHRTSSTAAFGHPAIA